MKHRGRALTSVLLTVGTTLTVLGAHFFKLPNHFSTGGVSGIGILLGELTPGISAGTYTAVLNVVFVVLGFLVLGKQFGGRSVYCALLYSVELQLLDWFVPLSAPLTDQKMLELLFSTILPAVGSAILFKLEASSGGTEVLALIMKKFTALDTGKGMMCVDCLFTATTFFLFDLETCLYSFLGLICRSTFVDITLEQLQQKKALLIVTEYPDDLLDYIIENIHRGATYWEASGAFSNRQRWVVMTVVNRSQALRLRAFLRREDPQAFILSENSSEIYGRGFLKT